MGSPPVIMKGSEPSFVVPLYLVPPPFYARPRRPPRPSWTATVATTARPHTVICVNRKRMCRPGLGRHRRSPRPRDVTAAPRLAVDGRGAPSPPWPEWCFLRLFLGRRQRRPRVLWSARVDAFTRTLPSPPRARTTCRTNGKVFGVRPAKSGFGFSDRPGVSGRNSGCGARGTPDPSAFSPRNLHNTVLFQWRFRDAAAVVVAIVIILYCIERRICRCTVVFSTRRRVSAYRCSVKNDITFRSVIQ